MSLSSADQARLTSLLVQVGCNAHDSGLYLHCLSHGAQSIQQIAKQLQAKRTTIHAAVERMIDGGLLRSSVRGKRRVIVAQKPENLVRLIEKKQQELEVAKANIDYISKALADMIPQNGAQPAVTFYEGIDGLKRMLEDTLEAQGEVLVFTHVSVFSELLGTEYLENYYRRRAAKNISTRLIFPPCDFANRVLKNVEAYKMKIRLLPEGVSWKSGIFAWNNKIAIKSFTEGKITCTIIENEDIAFFYRNIVYELCWKQAGPLNS